MAPLCKSEHETDDASPLVVRAERSSISSQRSRSSVLRRKGLQATNPCHRQQSHKDTVKNTCFPFLEKISSKRCKEEESEGQSDMLHLTFPTTQQDCNIQTKSVLPSIQMRLLTEVTPTHKKGIQNVLIAFKVIQIKEESYLRYNS